MLLPMKLIIAGGRNYNLTDEDYRKLDTISNVTTVVSGCAHGADKCGEYWAFHSDIPVEKFPADWSDLEAPGAVIKHGFYGPYNANAGFHRNLQMAQYADAVALFPGGRGTQNMHDTAKRLGLTIYDFRT